MYCTCAYIIMSLCTVCPAIKQEMGAIDWDNPQSALLSLANTVERHMGGSSGAVSLPASIMCVNSCCCVSLHCLQIYTLFLTAGANAVSSWSEPASWAVALQEGLQAIMRCEGLLRHQTLAGRWPAILFNVMSCVLSLNSFFDTTCIVI